MSLRGAGPLDVAGRPGTLCLVSKDFQEWRDHQVLLTSLETYCKEDVCPLIRSSIRMILASELSSITSAEASTAKWGGKVIPDGGLPIASRTVAGISSPSIRSCVARSIFETVSMSMSPSIAARISSSWRPDMV